MGKITRTGRAGNDNSRHVETFGRSRTRSSRTRRGRGAAALTVLVALGISACGSDNDSSSVAAPEAPAEVDRPEESGDRGLAIGVGESEAVSDAAAPATGGSARPSVPIDFGRDLIVEAGVTMLTPNVSDAIDDVIRLAGTNGGAVFNANVTVEDPLEDGSIPGGGTIVIRVPPTQLDRLIGDLRGVGTLRNQTQTVADVTDQLIDLDIQIRQAFESVERMEAILADTTDFDSLVAAEVELVRRQTAYERLLAAQRSVDDRVALSTLTVEIQYRSPALEDVPVEEGGDKGITDAFNDGWTAFVGILFGLAFVLAVTAPFLAVGLVVVLIGWIVSRRLRRRQDIARNRSEPIDQPLPAPTHQSPAHQSPAHAAPDASTEADAVTETESSDDSVHSNPTA